MTARAWAPNVVPVQCPHCHAEMCKVPFDLSWGLVAAHTIKPTDDIHSIVRCAECRKRLNFIRAFCIVRLQPGA